MTLVAYRRSVVKVQHKSFSEKVLPSSFRIILSNFKTFFEKGQRTVHQNCLM